MLRKAVAPRGAEWLWLRDLSSADQYHILPIIMVVFQLLVQLWTPPPGHHRFSGEQQNHVFLDLDVSETQLLRQMGRREPSLVCWRR
jgi:membrane protein insertase Oxa1/YidC/SpoIIIJ